MAKLSELEKQVVDVAFTNHQAHQLHTLKMKRTNHGYIDFYAGFQAGLTHSQKRIEELELDNARLYARLEDISQAQRWS